MRRIMKTLIAIPAMEQMHSWTVQCLETLRRVGECDTEFIIRMQIDMARNVLAQKACEGGYDRVLWLDSDMTFEPDLMERLSDDLEQYDIATGLYFKRTFPLEPVIYSSLAEGKAVTFWDYPQDSLFEVAGCGFGGVLMRTEVLRGLSEPPFLPFLHLGEDLSFCARMAEKGRKIACDSRIKMGHMGTIVFSEKLYKHPKG